MERWIIDQNKGTLGYIYLKATEAIFFKAFAIEILLIFRLNFSLTVSLIPKKIFASWAAAILGHL